jgi:hypothetical protein
MRRLSWKAAVTAAAPLGNGGLLSPPEPLLFRLAFHLVLAAFQRDPQAGRRPWRGGWRRG